jgi:hypothetical protein
MVDEPGAIPIFVPAANVFPGYLGNKPKWICLHKTASGGTAQDVAHFFQTVPDRRSAHYIIGQDGTIVQCVSEADGAGANCCLEAGYAAFLPTGINLNLLTISIEHCDPASDNSTPLTSAQKASSFRLVRDICQRHAIPMRAGDASGGIIGHDKINPVTRARCPGNYPWNELFSFLGGGAMGVPAGWHDDGTTLTAPNGVPVRYGFREYILANNWDANNWALTPEFATGRLEDSNPPLGGGSQQIFRWSMLGYPSTTHRVVFEWLGQELIVARQQVAKYYPAYQELQKVQGELEAANTHVGILQGQLEVAGKQIVSLQEQVAALEKQLQTIIGIPVDVVQGRMSAIDKAVTEGANALTDIHQLATSPF